jgi:hypothetical protein
VDGLRDYEQWQRRYDDPTSDLSWRLRTVRGHIEQALDRYPGPIGILSSCSGDGRDVLAVLARRADAQRVSAVLVDLHPAIAERARRSAASVAANVEVRTADAGVTDESASPPPASPNSPTPRWMPAPARPSAWSDTTGRRNHFPR